MPARMLPQKPSGDAPISEVKIFDRLRTECPEDWSIIHSLGLANHNKKLWAEADFVVINPAGVLVLEVKGGAIRREGGTWYSNDKALDEAPLHQVSGASAALRGFLFDRGLASGGIVDGAVLLPDVLFKRDGADIDSGRIGDAKSIDVSIATWINDVQAHCQRNLLDRHPRLELAGLSMADREAIVEALAGDFELRPSLAATTSDARREMLRFTEEQEEALHVAEDNPRALIEGGAGTGKTVLALQHAMKAASEGSSVLLVCFNKAPALTMGARTANLDRVDVFHFHGLVDHLLDLSGAAHPKQNGDKYFSHDLPGAAIEALAEIEDPPLYDYLVVDEAQDLIYGMALDVFDCVLKGGIESGNWCIFRDSKQDIYGVETPAALSRLLSAHPARTVLRRNCRNTAEIAEFTARCSARKAAPTLPIAGPEVTVIDFDEFDDLRKSSARVLRDWIGQGIDPGSIVVLSANVRPKSALSDGMPPGVPAPLEDLAKNGELQNPAAIRFSTIHSFKGLEADAVLLLNVGNLEDAENQKLLYVGLSRARLLLAVGVPARQKARFLAMA